MVELNLSYQSITFTNNTLWFHREYKLRIEQVIYLPNRLIIRGMPERQLSPPSPFFHPDFNRNTVYIFDLEGNLLQNIGRKMDGEIRTFPAYMNMDGRNLKLSYQSNCQVWYDIESGEILKEEYVIEK